MKLITFNIRNALAQDGANGWEFRKDYVYEYLLKSDADVICLQEIVPPVREELAKVLKSVYECVGEGRLAETKEYDEINLVVYKKSAFELLEKQHFWLSDTPDVAGSRYQTQIHWPRTCTHVTLKDKNGVYNIFATHLDNEDKFAREKGLKLIMSRAGSNGKTIICGDFNDTPDHVLKWVDGRFIDLTLGLPPTYTEYGREYKKIDYIFASKDVTLLSEAVCDEQIKDGLYISDHFPVYVGIV